MDKKKKDINKADVFGADISFDGSAQDDKPEAAEEPAQSAELPEQDDSDELESPAEAAEPEKSGFFKQYLAVYNKSCIAPEQKDIVDNHTAAFSVCVGVIGAVLVVVCVLMYLTVGFTPDLGITSDEFIDIYNSVPDSVSPTDAALEQDIHSFIPLFESVNIPDGSKLDDDNSVLVYNDTMKISAEMNGKKIKKLSISNVSFPYYFDEFDGFIGISANDYSYFYFYYIMGKALAAIPENSEVYDAYSAATYAFYYQYYSLQYAESGMANDYTRTFELDDKTIVVGFNNAEDCLYIEAVSSPILSWPDSLKSIFESSVA